MWILIIPIVSAIMIDPHLYEKVHRGTQLMSGDMSVDKYVAMWKDTIYSGSKQLFLMVL